MRDPTITSARGPDPFSDTLQLYRARIVSKPDPGDDRIQIRIIPHMIDIADVDLLPFWPPFFSNQVIQGISEKDDKANAEYVWCAAIPDFTVGFVLGPANNFESAEKSKKFSKSYNYTDMIQGLIQRGIAPPDTDYKNLYIQYWNSNYIEMVNIKTGDKFSILGNGTILALHRNQIYMRVGGSNEEFSAIRLSQEEINFVTQHFRVKAKKITLGNKGLYVTGVSSALPLEVEGCTFHPQTTIQV